MELYFSEEEYGQIELLPSCNYHTIQEKIRCPDLFPYHRVELDQLKISVEEYRKLVNAIIPSVPRIRSCYGGFCHHVFANAENEMVVVYHETADDILSTVWLTLDIKTRQTYQIAYDVLNQIKYLESLILVDWGWGITFHLRDTASLEEYLTARLRTFQKNL